MPEEVEISETRVSRKPLQSASHGPRSSMNRRRFLKRATAWVAGAAVPSIVPASAIGANGRVSPSNRIVIGQVGFNWIGNAHLYGFLHNSQVQFLGACEAFAPRLEATRAVIDRHCAERMGKADYKGCRTYTDFREMFAAPDIDAVVIAAPDHWHAAMSIEAARAGKDVYCEKPMTRTIAEARAVVQAMRRHGRVFQTGSQQRSEFGGMFRRAVELVRSGRIGRIVSAYVGVGGPPRPYDMPAERVPEGLDWEMWLGPAPWVPYNSACCPEVRWRWFSEFCGGGFSDMGAHHFDIVQWALDMDESGPVEIIAPDEEDQRPLTFRYAGGAMVYHGGKIDVDLRGTDGRIMVAREYLRSEPPGILQEPLGAGDAHLDRGRDHRDDWLHCIRTRQRPIADVEIGCRTATLCQLGNIAFELKRPLRWDPRMECFIDDPAAERLKSRAMRDPWSI